MVPRISRNFSQVLFGSRTKSSQADALCPPGPETGPRRRGGCGHPPACDPDRPAGVRAGCRASSSGRFYVVSPSGARAKPARERRLLGPGSARSSVRRRLGLCAALPASTKRSLQRIETRAASEWRPRTGLGAAPRTLDLQSCGEGARHRPLVASLARHLRVDQPKKVSCAPEGQPELWRRNGWAMVPRGIFNPNLGRQGGRPDRQ